MAATFRPVNTPTMATMTTTTNMPDLTHDDSMPSPTTPRTSTAPVPMSRPADDATTPTRASFSAALAGQKPLPTSPFPESVQVPESVDSTKTPSRGHSQRSAKSKDSDEMDMDGSDDEGSDEEEINADGTKSKKKKSQKFYCTDYPPCNLSFTRSEHLARHIRKHTGERPFQCHCSRRFSRLDNLRQHAQTVHVNEDIPTDSLAATGTRFQRQIRTDRVRQTGRSRASTVGNAGPVHRGHSKSFSTSSIASIGSINSAHGVNAARPRPPPLIMADPGSRQPFDPYRNPEQQQYYHRPHSPSEFSTPNSATFSTGQGSPRWGSGVASPISSHSRSHSMYTADSRTPGRRLSVPSGGNPFQSPHGAHLRGPSFNAPTLSIPNGNPYSPSQGSLLSSPTASTSGWSRRDSFTSAADEAWRRRTWHPDTRDLTGGSRLNQVTTPPRYPSNPPGIPAVSLPDRESPTRLPDREGPIRLPGIASFDPIPHRPRSPPRRIPSPMMVDSRAGPPLNNSSGMDYRREPIQPSGMDYRREANQSSGMDYRREPNHHSSVDYRRESTTHLQHGLNRLEINTPPRDSAGAWANEVNQAVQARGEQARTILEPAVRFQQDVKPAHIPTTMAQSTGPPMHGSPGRHQYTMSAPMISTPRESKRRGWYHGPVTVHPAGDTIHEGRPHVDRIIHPNVSAFQGFPGRDSQPSLHPQSSHGVDRMERIMERPHPSNNARLDALVAVATSEGKAY
ncbi:hypothetical protein QBC39DRAFT_62519 [Podospora conica]|nr:hypothetical protein QBC39DRAFT_62519 [Schizothecium conicum]